MRRLILIILFILLLTSTVNATEFVAPEAPQSAEKYLPPQSGSFGEDLWYIIKNGISNVAPDLADAGRVCFSLIGIVLLASLLRCFSGTSVTLVETVSALAIGALLIQPSNSLLTLGIQTVNELSQYGKLLLPVMTAAFAAQGATTTSTALYTGTVLFDTLLTSGITKFVIPLSYIFIALSIAAGAITEPLLQHLRKFIKWLMTWGLKIPIYLFTGYLGITRVVSGTVDASAIKAAKIAISGMIPLVGKIVSDASETVLVSVGIMKNTAGIYGMLAMLGVLIGPFLKIGIQYLMLKLTAAICSVLECKKPVTLIQDFSAVMGFILAATGTVCLFLIISTVCFMRGVV